MIRNSRGVTLTELMVAVAIISVGVVGAIGAFQYITRSIRLSRIGTIATNLGQEKVESLKNLSYSMLLVTTSTIIDSNFSPALTYDSSNYPPETLALWGGTSFKRSVYVAYADAVGGTISTVPYTSNDTGLKLITVHVLWNQDGAWRKLSLTNLLENPSVATLDATITGAVTKTTGGSLPGALVTVVGNPQWQANADASGNYSFSVAHGSYTVSASSDGYRSQTSAQLSVAAAATVTQNFSLQAIGTGTISSSSVYFSPTLLVTQVVSSTVTTVGDGSSLSVEYLELFNPTTTSINIGSGAAAVTKINYRGQSAPDDVTNIPLTYVSTYVAPGRFYLISNATSFVTLGSWVTADAYYAFPYSITSDIIKKNKAGALQAANSAGTILDGAGWSKDETDADGPLGNAPWAEGTAIVMKGGLREGNQIVRMSSACALNTSYGRAYDGNNNATDFFYSTAAAASGYFNYAPYNTATSRSNISGVPAVGGYASADDGLSSAANLATGYNTMSAPSGQSCPYASFSIPRVATGTWTVQVSTGQYSQTIYNAVVTQGATTFVLNAATTPPDPTSLFYVPIASATTNGYVYGTVTSGTGGALSGITVSAGGQSSPTNSSGVYFISTSSGTVTATANPNQANPAYISQAASVVLQTGIASEQNFVLSAGGVIRGYVTTGLSALAGTVVTATKNTGGAYGSAASDATGNFYIRNLATGTYSVAPSLDSGQTAAPTSFPTVALPSGGSVFAGTFTVTGAFATIKGNVTNAGSAITTGILLIASSGTINSPPNAVDASVSASGQLYYTGTSQADGTYSLLVRGSTTYTYSMRAFYPIVNINTGAASYTSKTKSGLSVAPGATLSAQDFTWP